jgi:hypothetical protein
VVLDRNSLDDIRNTNSVRYATKNGELYEAETMDQVWPVQRKLPKSGSGGGAGGAGDDERTVSCATLRRPSAARG